MLGPQRILGRQSACLKLGPARLLFRFQAQQLGFQLLDLLGGEAGGGIFFLNWSRSDLGLGNFRRAGLLFGGCRRDRRGRLCLLLALENLQQLRFVFGQRAAQLRRDGAFWRINDQTIVARGLYLDAFFAEFGEQIAGCHNSITSRSGSIDGAEGWGAGVAAGKLDAAEPSSRAAVAQASIACLIKVRGTLRSVSVCISEFKGPIAAGSRRSIKASTAVWRTSGAGSSSAAIRCGVASRSCTKLSRRAAAARSTGASAMRRSRVASSK